MGVSSPLHGNVHLLLSIREKSDSNMPPQMDKNTVMYLRARKFFTSHYYNRMTKEGINKAYKFLIRMDATVPKVRAAPTWTHTQTSRAISECPEVVIAGITSPCIWND